MQKRAFLKSSSILAGGDLLSRFVSCKPRINTGHLKNWAGNLAYSTGNVYYPKTVEEVQAIVKKCNKFKAQTSIAGTRSPGTGLPCLPLNPGKACIF